MKSLCFLAITFLLSTSVQSQFFEDFEGSVFPPNNWELYTTSNGLPLISWGKSNDTAIVLSDNQSAWCDRANIGPNAYSEQWLITPAITIGSNGILSFLNSQTLLGDQGSTFQLRICTTQQNDYQNYITIDNWSETDINQFPLRQISLTQYQGQVVYLAFVRCHLQPTLATSGDRWIIDNVTVNGVLSSNDFYSKNDLPIISNPVDTFIIISMPSSTTIQSIAIYNSLGQLVKTLSAIEIQPTLSIDVSALKTGTYFMEIVSNKGKTAQKFIKR